MPDRRPGGVRPGIKHVCPGAEWTPLEGYAAHSTVPAHLNLKGKVALVTSGTRGLGWATAAPYCIALTSELPAATKVYAR